MSIDFIVNNHYHDLRIIDTSKNVAILPGTFDPLHAGHIEVANQVLEYQLAEQNIDLVLFYPHHHSSKKSPAPLQSRILLAKHFISSNPRMGVLYIPKEDQLEMNNSDKHWTEELFQKLSDYHPLNYSRIIGSDRIKKAIKDGNDMTYFVCPREGMLIQEHLPLNFHLLKGTYNTHRISSTEIRNGDYSITSIPKSLYVETIKLYPKANIDD